MDDCATTTIVGFQVDSAVGDLFYGFVIFFVTMFFIIWFFRKHRV